MDSKGAVNIYRTVLIIAVFLSVSIPSAYAPTFVPAPVVRSLCPSGCECLTETEAYTKFDGNFEQCPDTSSCGSTYEKEFRVLKYCYREKTSPTRVVLELPEEEAEPEPEVEPEPEMVPEPATPDICPSGCECLTGPAAEKKFGTGSFKSCSGESCGTGWEGDLKLNKYCYSEIPLSECKDTDDGKDYEVKGSAPMCEDECSEFSKNPSQVVKECYVDIIDGKCKVNIDYHDCDSVCKDGVCLPPTCGDWIQNQDEEGVDCGGPCPDSCVCPSGCKCSTVVDAERVFGSGSFTKCSEESCGHGWQGDLQLEKYCYKKIESYDCTDSDGGADVYVKGTAPGCEDKCSTDRVLQECTVIQNIDSCDVHQSEYECEGACKDGACQPPSCDDGIQNQDEVSIDCSKKSIYSDCDSCCNNGIRDYDEEGVDCGGSDCIPCGWVPVKGKILYEDTDTATGQFKPVRFAKFYLRLCEENPCQTPTHEAEWSTDSTGYFSFMVPRENFKSMFIVFGHKNDYFDINYAVRLSKDLDNCNEYVYWVGYSKEIPATGSVNFGDLKIGMNSNIDFEGYWKETTDGFCGGDDLEGPVPGGSAYFNIADAILYARQYADGKRSDDDSIGYVDVQYPDSDWSNYNPTWEEITLYRGTKEGTFIDHGFEDGTAVHEFGHHLETTISTGDDYWGSSDHNFCTYGKDEEFAWSEGFSEYFGTIVPYNYPSLSNPDKTYGELETPNCEEYGWEGEATVAAILWDLVDDPWTYYQGAAFENFDTIKGKEKLIIEIMDDDLDNVGDAGDLCEFIEQGWNCRVDDPEKSMINALLSNYGVDCETGCDD